MPTSSGDEHHDHGDKAPHRVLSGLRRRPHRPDRMEQIVEEARDAGMLHGKLGRVLLRNCEAYQGLTWMQRGVMAVVVTTIICLVAILLKMPGFVTWPIFIVGFLIAGIYWLIGMGHEMRSVGYSFRRTPEERKLRWWNRVYNEETTDDESPENGEDGYPNDGTEYEHL